MKHLLHGSLHISASAHQQLLISFCRLLLHCGMLHCATGPRLHKQTSEHCTPMCSVMCSGDPHCCTKQILQGNSHTISNASALLTAACGALHVSHLYSALSTWEHEQTLNILQQTTAISAQQDTTTHLPPVCTCESEFLLAATFAVCL